MAGLELASRASSGYLRKWHSHALLSTTEREEEAQIHLFWQDRENPNPNPNPSANLKTSQADFNRSEPLLQQKPPSLGSPQARNPKGLQSSSFRALNDQILALCKNRQVNGTIASPSKYLSLLKSCLKSKSLNQARKVHAHVALDGLELTVVGEYLVLTFAKCDGFEDAYQIFHKLPCRTVLAWTSIILSYTDSGREHEALRMYGCMLEEGVQPNKYTFVSLLKACSNIPAVEEGMKLHADACKKGFSDSCVFVGSTLVNMYGKCGSIFEAEEAFGEMWQHNVASWNAMLTAYVENDEGEKALQLFRQMREETTISNERTFVIVLQACGNLAKKEDAVAVDGGWALKVTSFEIGQMINSEVWRKGFISDLFVANALVSMFGKCGSTVEAEKVFGVMFQCDVVSWTAMLAAYVENGQGEKALQLYREMQWEGVSPNERTFAVALQACCTVAEKQEAVLIEGKHIKVTSLDIGRALHADALCKGFIADVFVGSTLMNMYAKCGSIEEAENVFAGLSEHNVVLWTVLLLGHVEQGQGGRTLQLYIQMQDEGVILDKPTLMIALQACCILAEKESAVIVEGQATKMISLEIGQALHADAQNQGFAFDAFLGSALVSLYSKCGSLEEAEKVFDVLSERDIVSWNSLLSAYNEQGQAEKVLHLYRQMQREGISPNVWTFLIAIKACGALAEEGEDVVEGGLYKVRSLGIGKGLHADAWRKGFASNLFIGSALVNLYGKCGSIGEAEGVFGGLLQSDVVAWTAMLFAYTELGHGVKSLQLYRQMQEDAVSPDDWAFVIVLQACCNLAEKKEAFVGEGLLNKTVSLEIGRALHVDALRKGVALDVCVCTALVSMYGKCGSVAESETVFHHVSHCDVALWNSMLLTYVEQGQQERALLLYKRMQEESMTMNDMTLVRVLQACSKIASMDICRHVHFTFVSYGNNLSFLLANSLVHAYGTSASMRDAEAVFEGLPWPDLVSCNALISGYAQEGNCAATLHTFEAMQVIGIIPDGVTFLSLLSTCSHVGFVDKGVECFECMSKNYSIVPDNKHHVTLISLLGQAGDFTMVQNMLSRMPMQSDLAVWLCLLAACRVYGNVELGKQAFDQAVHVQSKDPYVHTKW